MANIQKRGDNSWFLTVNIGRNSKGKYIRRTKTINCRTKREAESEYWKFRQEVEVGEYISPRLLINHFLGYLESTNRRVYPKL